MTVFTLPSYPYVFKVIRDRIAASKDTDRQKVKQKYWLVKHHDRVGRMTDILEYSDVAFPRERFSDELIAELQAVAPSVIEFERDHVVVRHLYIERRMIPLNLYLEHADDAQRAHAMREYGDALKELAAVNIFAGDLLFKNFGVTRFGRVVFYDYDEIEYLVDCNFRRIPPPPPGWDDMSDDVWYPVARNDVFPEEFETFLLTDPKTRACFRQFHADLLDPQWWQATQRAIRTGRLVEVLSYPDAVRFAHPVAPRIPAARTRPAGRNDAWPIGVGPDETGQASGASRACYADFRPQPELAHAHPSFRPMHRAVGARRCPCRDARAGRLRQCTRQGRAGSRQEHVRLPALGRAPRHPVRRRRGAAADARRRPRGPLPDPERFRRPLFQRQAGASRQGHGLAARAGRHGDAARGLPALPGPGEAIAPMVEPARPLVTRSAPVRCRPFRHEA